MVLNVTRCATLVYLCALVRSWVAGVSPNGALATLMLLELPHAAGITAQAGIMQA